jgi:hypothetical protein
MKHIEVYAVRLTDSRVPGNQSISLETPHACELLPRSTRLLDR